MPSSSSNLVIFGVSNMLSDIVDAALAVGLTVSKIVKNQAEVIRERTKSLQDRLSTLPAAPAVQMLDDFVPAEGECYVTGVTSPAKATLVQSLQESYGIRFHTIIHPTAYVSPSSELGEGVFVGANSVVAPGSRIGNHVFINRGVTLGHDSQVREYSRLLAGCNVGGHTTLEPGVTIGLGASVIEELVIGEGAFVAAGATVIRDVEPDTLVAGVPAVFKKHLNRS